MFIGIFIATALFTIPIPSWLPPTFVEPAAGPLPQIAWWTEPGLVGLEALIEEGLSENGDIAATRTLIRKARAQTEQAFSPLLPSVSFDTTLNAAPMASFRIQNPSARAL